jgi:hypothetical protein
LAAFATAFAVAFVITVALERPLLRRRPFERLVVKRPQAVAAPT